MTEQLEEPPRSLVCVLCKFDAAPDDVAVKCGTGVICERCYRREIGDELHMDKRLRADVTRVVNAAN